MIQAEAKAPRSNEPWSALYREQWTVHTGWAALIKAVWGSFADIKSRDSIKLSELVSH